MDTTQSNNKRIAKNAVTLYFRMFISMAIGFYTSRVVLQALGVSDFGVYNLVGGIVVMMGMINGALNSATTRFLTYGLGLKDEARLKTTFSTAFLAHAALSLVFLILAETIGLWIVNTQLVIPPDRMVAANWAYQSAILSTALGITQVPYNASITSHEHFGIFAALDITNSVLKLAIALAVLYSSCDHLIEYSVLYTIVAIAIMLFYRIYCIRNFKECRVSRNFSKPLFKEMLSFTGWNMFGNVSLTFSQQGIAIIFNWFFGTVINAAMGVSNQVTAACYAFTNNISTAFNPQIIKEWANENYERVNYLINIGARFSGVATLLITIPIICNMEFLLNLWLEKVPDGSIIICQIALISNFFNSFTPMVYTAITASGDIKKVNILCAILFLLRLPIGYVVLCFTKSYILVLAICIYIPIVSAVFYLKILHEKNTIFSISKFMAKTILPTTLIGLISILVGLYVNNLFAFKVVSVLLSLVIPTIITISLSYKFLIDEQSRILVKSYIKRRISL